jgi:hypothetical protein
MDWSELEASRDRDRPALTLSLDQPFPLAFGLRLPASLLTMAALSYLPSLALCPVLERLQFGRRNLTAGSSSQHRILLLTFYGHAYGFRIVCGDRNVALLCL